MGVVEDYAKALAFEASQRSVAFLLGAILASVIILSVSINVVLQLVCSNTNEPPVVFHWFPIVGSTVTYGIDPYRFFSNCQSKYGDVFTFVLLGKKSTVYLGKLGNEFILNGKLKDVNAEEIYRVLTTPVFGTDVVYDCPNSKLMEQKKVCMKPSGKCPLLIRLLFMKIGLSTAAFKSYVPIIQMEVEDFIKRSMDFKGDKGSVNLSSAMAEMTIYTASHTLQGKEVREKFDSKMAALYHDLDMGFSAINFALHWAPLPHNRARDHAQRTVAGTYISVIKRRREQVGDVEEGHDIMWELMRSTYKDGSPVPDKEIANMMIALLMAGQHSSSSTITWILLRLASRPDIQEELYQEQIQVLGAGNLDAGLPPLRYEDLAHLTLHQAVLKEVLRLHTPIHSIMRKVKSPMPVSGTKYIIPTSHVLVASPGFSARDEAHFPEPLLWNPHRWDAGSANMLGQGAKEIEEKEDYGYGLISKGASSPYLPFGAGRHRCIGEQFAQVQLVTITAIMVRLFKIKSPDCNKIAETDYASLFTRPLGEGKVNWERR